MDAEYEETLECNDNKNGSEYQNIKFIDKYFFILTRWDVSVKIK